MRPYANFVNHENFCCALALRRHLIFDGSARDPTNICGRVISRLRRAGYRVVFLVVLSSFAVSRRRAAARQAQTGRETSESFTRFVFTSLQAALPIYLRNVGAHLAADGVLIFENESDDVPPKLAFKLVAGTPKREHDAMVSVASSRCVQLLQLP